MDAGEFIKAVCKSIKNATPNEKRAVEKELRDHLDDHAEAPISAGRSREEAYADAVAAMGDPDEIGSELNKEYPKLWLIFSRVAAVLLIAVALVLARPLLYSFKDNAVNLACRAFPAIAVPDYSQDFEQTPIDVSMDAVSGDVVRFCSECIVQSYDSVRPEDYLLYKGENDNIIGYNGYVALLTAVVYDKVPFRRTTSLYDDCISFPDIDGDWHKPVQGCTGGRSYSYYMVMAPVERGQKSVTLAYDKYGVHSEAVIPLDWSGVK